MVINIKLHLYQSWVSHVSIQGKRHVVILINYKLLIILFKSIFKTPMSFVCVLDCNMQVPKWLFKQK
jgi:hypothetical protein